MRRRRFGGRRRVRRGRSMRRRRFSRGIRVGHRY